MAKEEKRCKECEGKGKDECECPKKAKKGWYGLERHYQDDDGTMDPDHPGDGGSEGGAMGEGVKMPQAPSDADKDMQGITAQKKKKKLEDFHSSVADAKKRQSDQDRKDQLYLERKRKGIKFYDSKGTGYIKNGKKHYD